MNAAQHHDRALLLLRITETGVRDDDLATLAELAAWHEQQAVTKALDTIDRAPACDCFPGGTCHDCRAAATPGDDAITS